MGERDTIVALASGALPSAIAVVRVSGSRCAELLRAFTLDLPKPRNLVFRKIVSPDTGDLIDEGMVAYMPGPESFTGEDCAEFHLHGSVAVVDRFIWQASAFDGVRLATAGEFSRRAFESGKLDLTQVQGLADLILSETENQRIQSLSRMRGQLGEKVSAWRSRIIALMALVEAQLDFSDESDVELLDWNTFCCKLSRLRKEVQDALNGYERGRIVREGFRIGLGGPPNVGKSSLLNRLADSDLAIVTSEAGTTRDVREVCVSIGGQLVLLYDGAGLRETEDAIEYEGVQRAKAMLENADLVLWLTSPDTQSDPDVPAGFNEVIRLNNKMDLGECGSGDLSISCKTGAGIDGLTALLAEKAQARGGSEGSLICHLRDKECLSAAERDLMQLEAMARAESREQSLELIAECLQRTGHQMQRLLGLVDTEQVLDRLFSGFCIGK